jgi:tetratricopeptide (TPR) repeat protein
VTFVQTRFCIALLSALAGTEASCGRRLSPDSNAAQANGSPKNHACGPPYASALFRRQRATHILVLDFEDGLNGDGAFAKAVAGQIEAELKTFREEEMSDSRGVAPSDNLEVQRLPCYAKDHEHARDISTATNADVVLWGRTAISPRMQAPPVNLNVKVGNVVATSSSVSIGSVKVAQDAPYAISPSATWRYGGISTFRTASAMSFNNLLDIDLPALKSTEPFQLVTMALAFHFHESQQPELAIRFLKRVIEHEGGPGQKHASPFSVIWGQSLLQLPGHEKEVIKMNLDLLNEHEIRGTSIESNADLTIGMAYLALGKSETALMYLDRALVVERDLAEVDALRKAIYLNQRGLALLDLERFDEALVVFKQALGTFSKTGNDGQVGMALNNIGISLLHLQKPESALQSLEAACSKLIQHDGVESPGLVSCFANKAAALRDCNRLSEAREEVRKAAALSKKLWSADDPRRAIPLREVGILELKEGDFDSAIADLSEALEIGFRANKHGSLEVALELNGLGNAYISKGYLTEAVEAFEAALTVDLEVFGPDAFHFGVDLDNLGSTLAMGGRCKDAVRFQKRAVHVLALDQNSGRDLVLAQDHLALCLATLSGWKGAEARGAIVASVREGSQAAVAGLKVGDWIVEYQGPFEAGNDYFEDRLGHRGKGETAKIIVVRSHRRKALQVPWGDFGARLLDGDKALQPVP